MGDLGFGIRVRKPILWDGNRALLFMAAFEEKIFQFIYSSGKSSITVNNSAMSMTNALNDAIEGMIGMM